MLRSVIDPIEIRPSTENGRHEAHLYGRLSTLVGLAQGKAPNEPDLGLTMVAGEGLEPPTRGL